MGGKGIGGDSQDGGEVGNSKASLANDWNSSGYEYLGLGGAPTRGLRGQKGTGVRGPAGTGGSGHNQGAGGSLGTKQDGYGGTPSSDVSITSC